MKNSIKYGTIFSLVLLSLTANSFARENPWGNNPFADFMGKYTIETCDCSIGNYDLGTYSKMLIIPSINGQTLVLELFNSIDERWYGTILHELGDPAEMDTPRSRLPLFFEQYSLNPGPGKAWYSSIKTSMRGRITAASRVLETRGIPRDDTSHAYYPKREFLSFEILGNGKYKLVLEHNGRYKSVLDSGFFSVCGMKMRKDLD